MKETSQNMVYFNSRDKLIRLNILNVVFFEADGNYTNMVTTNKHKACLTINLLQTEKALADQLGDTAHQFIRIGKRFVVNRNFIFQIDILKQELMLSDMQSFVFRLPVAKEALKSLKSLVINIKI